MAGADGRTRLPSLADAAWLSNAQTRAVLRALTANGADARAVGGAVRNALLGAPVKDVDIATTATPQEVIRLAEQAGLNAIPTGIEHGTVTVVADKVPFEVTTLRRDIETFGRHARVTFTTDWREDAMRRDFTMNALYCDADGRIYDPLGGREDLEARRVRFIGDATERIREDYLRILRFFRFHAAYGDATPPDAEGLAAAAREKDGLAQLSGERIRAELLLLLATPGAIEALHGLDKIGAFAPMLGFEADVDAVARLAAIEAALGRQPDPILRLAALCGPNHERAAERLRLSSAEARRLLDAARRDAAFDPLTDENAAKAFIFHHGTQAFVDGALMDWTRSGNGPAATDRAARLRMAELWDVPVLPVRGSDVVALGIAPGPGVGRVMAAFADWWVGAGFPSDAEAVHIKLGELVAAEKCIPGGS